MEAVITIKTRIKGLGKADFKRLQTTSPVEAIQTAQYIHGAKVDMTIENAHKSTKARKVKRQAITAKEVAQLPAEDGEENGESNG